MTDLALDVGLVELKLSTDAWREEISSSATGLLGLRLNRLTHGHKYSADD